MAADKRAKDNNNRSDYTPTHMVLETQRNLKPNDVTTTDVTWWQQVQEKWSEPKSVHVSNLFVFL